MIKSYLTAAVRNLMRERGYALINIVGLSIGLAICLLVIAYVADEQSFDRFHANADRLYRVNKAETTPTGEQLMANTSFLLAPLIRENIPDVASVVQIIPQAGAVVSNGDRSFHTMITLADPEFFQIFSFKLSHGDAASVLKDPASVVLTHQFATKLFGRTNPVGQQVTITWAGKANQFTVVGLADDPPSNSSLAFELVIPMTAKDRFLRSSANWNTSWPETYILLGPRADRASVQTKLDLAAATAPKPAGFKWDLLFRLQPMTEIHLNPEISSASNPSDPLYSYLLGLVGAVVLGLACINFTTLAIGRSQRRVREIGVRKMIGATRTQVIGQILGETMLSALISMLLALVLAELLLPRFGALAGKQFGSILHAVGIWALPAICLVFLTALFAGGYTAMVLSRVKMVESVRGRAALLTGGGLTRILVLLQFSISAALIVVTLSMSHQLNYILNAPLGFDKEQLVMFRLDGSGTERANTVNRLREGLQSSPGILGVSAMSDDFAGGGLLMSNRVGPDSTELAVFINPVDREYLRTMRMELAAGRDFAASSGAPGATTDVIVNETLVRAMQWDDPIGKEAPMLEKTRIVGVVKDYHTEPFTTQIRPVALVLADQSSDWSESLVYALVRLGPGEIPASMATIETLWKEIAPQIPFDYEFVDARIDAQYHSYKQWATIMGNASTLAVLVACFGVFGLTALAVARRRREIGIRKVLGASDSQLVGMFYREFILLASIGTLIGWPVAYYAVNKWLAGFVYRASISPWPFIAGMVMLVLIVLMTVSLQAFRATATNPAQVIRCE